MIIFADTIVGPDTKRLKIEDPEQGLVPAMQKSSDH